ncbi:MAG: hypothetical protein M3440_08420 [Chloroflexota bacterium]|nr:hypothetical protein [Chloroflexota bacterium]
MFTALRLQLALIPFLWSLWQQDAPTDDNPIDGNATGPNGDAGASDAPVVKTYTSEQFRRALATQATKQREEIEAQVKADAESKRLEADQQWKELADKREAEKTDLRRQLEAREATERNRILRYEIRDAARDLAFADPDDAFHLIDRNAIEFNDDGEPTNVPSLVKALAEKKPHLVKQDGDGRRGTPAMQRGGTLPNQNEGESFLRSRYGTRQQAS